MSLLRLFLPLTLFLLFAPPVCACDKAWDDCAQETDRARAIKGCSQFLARGAAGTDLDRRAEAYRNRGVAYRDGGEHDRAIKDFDEAIRLDPRFASVFRRANLTP